MKISAFLSTSLLLSGVLLFLLVLSFTGCPVAGGSTPANNDPYPVTGNPTPDIAKSSQPQYYYLSIAEQGGQKDPDGDIVYFRSETLPIEMTLDSGTGVVTINSFGKPLGVWITIDFWSEDEHGADTSGTPFTVTFNICAC